MRPIAIATTIVKIILEGNGGGEVPLPKIDHNHHQQSNNNLLPYHNHFQTHYDGPYPLEQDNIVLVVAITVILIILIIIVVPVEVVVAIPVNAEEEV